MRTITWLLFCLCFAIFVQLSDAQDSTCADKSMKEKCGACGLCCCYKGPLPYVPDEDTCKCKPQYGRPFFIMVVMAILACICSLVGGWYFGGGHRISPYRRVETYLIHNSS